MMMRYTRMASDIVTHGRLIAVRSGDSLVSDLLVALWWPKPRAHKTKDWVTLAQSVVQDGSTGLHLSVLKVPRRCLKPKQLTLKC